jgi:hypothetical protein
MEDLGRGGDCGCGTVNKRRRPERYNIWGRSRSVGCSERDPDDSEPVTVAVTRMVFSLFFFTYE